MGHEGVINTNVKLKILWNRTLHSHGNVKRTQEEEEKKHLMTLVNAVVQWLWVQFRSDLPSLLQWTQARPLLCLRIKTLHGVKEFPVGASAHGVDFLIHGGVAAHLQGETHHNRT